jgi:hypothetical protein
MSQSLAERYEARIAGMVSCYDSVMITGTLPTICYAAGMAQYLQLNEIPIFDYAKFARELNGQVRERAAALAAEAGVKIEHISKAHVRKENVVARVLAQRGSHPGLVHIISAMEGCTSYRPRHDAETGRGLLRPASGKCLHDCSSFIDPDFGLIHLRVPTWCPFRLQFYCNGHAWLARQLAAEGIGYAMADNAFTQIDGWDRAQD